MSCHLASLVGVALLSASPPVADGASPRTEAFAPAEESSRSALPPQATPWPVVSETAATAPDVGPPTSSVPPPRPAVDLPRRKGTGLFIASGATGFVAWAMSSAVIGMVFTRCTAKQSWEQCVFDLESSAGLVVVRMAANWTSAGLAAGGGMLRGRYEGARDRGRRRRAMKPFVISGGVLIGVGLAAQIALRPAWLLGVSNTCAEILTTSAGPDGANECFRRRTFGYLASLQLSASAIAAGAGMLSFARAYAPRRRHGPRVTMMPAVTPRYQGLSVRATF